MFLIGMLLAVITPWLAVADDASTHGLKYFIVEGTLAARITGAMVDAPADVMAGANALVASIEGAELVGYYLLVGKPQNLAIIAVPDSKYAAAMTYQRMGTGALKDIEIYEVIPGENFKAVLDIAHNMDQVGK